MSAAEVLLSALGIFVAEVPELDVEICYVEDRRVALMRAGLAGEERDRALTWVISQSTSEEAA